MRLKRGSAGRPSSPGLTPVDCPSGLERLKGDTAASMARAACDVKAGRGMCCLARASLGINASPIYRRRHSPKSVGGLSESSVLNVMLQDWFHSSLPARLGQFQALHRLAPETSRIHLPRSVFWKHTGHPSPRYIVNETQEESVDVPMFVTSISAAVLEMRAHVMKRRHESAEESPARFFCRR
jgi:hypothetical protein